MDQVLNELSFCRFREPQQPCAAANRTEARAWMTTFVQTLSTTARLGLPRSLRTMESFAIQQIAPDYNLAQWRNDVAVDRDLRELFRQYSTKSPLLDGLLATLVDRSRGCEAKFEGVECKGLLVAYLLDCLAISLPSDAAWNVDRLKIALAELDEENGNVPEANETVLHCGSPEHAARHAAEFEARKRSTIATGRDLVDQKTRLLPYIVFCENAETVLRNLGSNDPVFLWVNAVFSS
jgi:hypothetical protein